MNFVRFYALGAVFLFSYCSVPIIASTVTGPEKVEPGKLITFEADAPGAFLIIPAKEGEFQVDSDGKRLYFASTTQGTYTLVYTRVEGGNISQTQKTFTVGKSSEPDPDPEPEPDPEPKPDDSLTAAITSSAKDLQSTTLTAEKKALQTSFETVTTGIENGSITTVADARAVLRVTWQNAAITIGKDVVGRWKPVLDAASAKMDMTTLNGIKAGCTEAAKALSQLVEDKPGEGCKDGKCPTPTYYRLWR